VWRVHRAFAIDGDRKTTTSMAVLRVVCRQIFAFRLCMSDARSCYRDAPQPLRLKVEPSPDCATFHRPKTGEYGGYMPARHWRRFSLIASLRLSNSSTMTCCGASESMPTARRRLSSAISNRRFSSSRAVQGRDSLLLFKEIRLFRGLPNLRPTRFLCSGNARACCGREDTLCGRG
jgi:hypothetical protein